MERASIVYSGKFSRNNQIQCSSFYQRIRHLTSNQGDELALTSTRNVFKTIIFRKLQTLWTFAGWLSARMELAGDKYILGIKIKICWWDKLSWECHTRGCSWAWLWGNGFMEGRNIQQYWNIQQDNKINFGDISIDILWLILYLQMLTFWQTRDLYRCGCFALI